MGRLKLYSGPAIEPVTLAEARVQMRVDISEDNDYIEGLIQSARMQIEKYGHRCMITQTWDEYFDEWPDGDALALMKQPLQSITSIVYTDSGGTAYTLSTDVYEAVSLPSMAVLKYNQTWPSATLKTVNAIRVRYVAGFGDAASDVPEIARTAIRLLTAHLYENREPVLVGAGVLASQIPFTIDSLVYLIRDLEPAGTVE